MHSAYTVGYLVSGEGNNKNYEAIDINRLFELLDDHHIHVTNPENSDKWIFVHDTSSFMSHYFDDSEAAAIAAGIRFNVIISLQEFENLFPDPYKPQPMTFVVKKTSWHYRLLSKFHGDWKMEAVTDLCTYTRLFIGMGSTFLFFAAFFISWITSLVWGLMWLYRGITDHFTPAAWDIWGLWLTCLCIVGYAGYHLECAISRWNHNRWERAWEKRRQEYDNPQLPPAPKEPGFIAVAYRNFKEKTCIRIAVED
jgi:hypothetical protein